jgi:tRNA isopentenyl-2-thiomethyl-A-37 hydroxylase MiaE
LYASEAGHYRQFIELARALPDARGVDKRWEKMLTDEAKIIRRQPVGPMMHGGVG